MPELGKSLIVVGVLLVLVGFALVLAGRLNLPIGRLPGDIVIRGRYGAFYFPLATCIVVSVLLSAVIYVMGRFSR